MRFAALMKVQTDGSRTNFWDPRIKFGMRQAARNLKGMAVPPAQVEILLAEGILNFVRCSALCAQEVLEVQKRASRMGLVGGIVYDFYHLAVAEKEDVDRFYTPSERHIAQRNGLGCHTRPRVAPCSLSASARNPARRWMKC